MPSDDANTVDKDGNSLLLTCAQYGFVELAEMLCQKGADVNLQNHSGLGALHMVCAPESFVPDIVEILLDHNADVTLTDGQYGSGPLHFLAGTGDTRLCTMLINRGADPSIKDCRACLLLS